MWFGRGGGVWLQYFFSCGEGVIRATLGASSGGRDSKRFLLFGSVVTPHNSLGGVFGICPSISKLRRGEDTKDDGYQQWHYSQVAEPLKFHHSKSE